MELKFTWINLLILFGAVQGVIVGFILLFNRKHPGVKFLSLLMFVLAYNGFETFNWSSQLNWGFFDLFPFILIFALGPSLYLYINSLMAPGKKITARKVPLHFGLVFIQLSISCTIATQYFLWKYGLLEKKASIVALHKIYHLYSEPLSVVAFLVYLYASIRIYLQSQKSSSKLVAKESWRIVNKWSRALLFCMVLLGVGWIVTVGVGYHFNHLNSEYYYPIELSLVLFVYWIAFAGYHRTMVIYPEAAKNSSGVIAESDAEKWLERLRCVMKNEKLYVNPDLNLNALANYTGIVPKTISTVLNQHLGKNFNDFVNDYRVREVCRKLSDPTYQHLTISGMALDSGFNSQATFQRSFKSIMGISPKEYSKKSIKPWA